MRTKEEILALFETNKGVYFSGEEIAERISVSRAAVWKAVRSLRNEGYRIDGIPNKGYSLAVDTDILSVQGIQACLAQDSGIGKVDVLAETDSTNVLARKQAEAGALEGSVFLANTQTAGRGRRGRSFFSPADTGIYLTLLLRPAELSSDAATGMTTMAAVAMCEAIEAVSGKKARIKWVNDIWLGDRKVCGILTEASLSMENNRIEYMILGAGINAYAPREGFPPELEQIAGAVYDRRQANGKNLLAGQFLNRFMRYYHQMGTLDYVEKYRKRSLAVGREVTVLKPSGKRKAFALDVDDTCALLVEYADGERERLTFGEISIKL